MMWIENSISWEALFIFLFIILVPGPIFYTWVISRRRLYGLPSSEEAAKLMCLTPDQYVLNELHQDQLILFNAPYGVKYIQTINHALYKYWIRGIGRVQRGSVLAKCIDAYFVRARSKLVPLDERFDIELTKINQTRLIPEGTTLADYKARISKQAVENERELLQQLAIDEDDPSWLELLDDDDEDDYPTIERVPRMFYGPECDEEDKAQRHLRLDTT